MAFTKIVGAGINTTGNFTFGSVTVNSIQLSDGKPVGGAGLGTAIDGNDQIYYTDTVLSIGSTTTINPPDSSNVAYTQYAEIAVEEGFDLIIEDGDDFVPDILGLSTGTAAPLAGAGGRVRADNFTDKAGTGAPTFPNGITLGSNTITLDGNANVINVGTALTLGHTEGLQYHTQNLHAGGFEVNNINASGIITATAFYGDGSNLVGAGATVLGGLDDVVVDNIGVGTDQTLIWNNSLGRWERGYANSLPIFGSATLTSSDSSSGRFSGEQFSLAINMNDEGYPVSTKNIKLSVADSTNIISRSTSSDISSVNVGYAYSGIPSFQSLGQSTGEWQVEWVPSLDRYVAIMLGTTSTSARIRYSYDGETWTSIADNSVNINGSSGTLSYIWCWAVNPNNGMIVISGWDGYNSNTTRKFYYTFDLINWYDHASTSIENYRSAYVSLKWVQPAGSTDGYFWAYGSRWEGPYVVRLSPSPGGGVSYGPTNLSYNQFGTALYYSPSQNILVATGQGNHAGYYHVKWCSNPDAGTPSWNNGWYVSSGVDMPYGVVYAGGSWNNWYWTNHSRQLRKGAPTSNFNASSGLTAVKDFSSEFNGHSNGGLYYIEEFDALVITGWDSGGSNDSGIIYYALNGNESTWYKVRFPEDNPDSYYYSPANGNYSAIAYSEKLRKYVLSISNTDDTGANNRITTSTTLGITTTRTQLTFTNAVGLASFSQGESVVQSDGNATGFVEAVDTSAGTMVVEVSTGTFTAGVGTFVSGNEHNSALVYANINSTGLVTSFSGVDPGFVSLSGSSPYTITMPAVDSSGVDLDAKFGAGSQISVNVQATNKLGSVSGSTTLTPTSSRSVSSFIWNANTDAYTNTTTAANRIIDTQARMRRCLVTDAGSVTYLDADDSTKLAGDWIRLCEHTELDTARTGTHGAETANTPLRSGLSTWSAGTYRRGQLVIHSSSVWECLVESTTSAPAAGSVSATLNGTAGQVMVEIPLFSVKHTRTASGSYNEHSFYLVRGVKTDDGYAVHPAFVQRDNSYRPFIYVGAYLGSGTKGRNSVSGQTNAVNYTRSIARDEARDRGNGWSIMSLYQYNAIQWLYLTEYQNMDSQEVLGNGAVTGSDYDVTTGLSNTRGNRCGNVYNADGSTNDYVSYRGIENVYGRAYQWVDGANVTSGTSLYVTSDRRYMLETTTQNMTSYATIGGSDGGHIRDLSAGVLFISSSTTSGSSTTYAADALSLSTGDRNMRVGGIAADGSSAGVFRQNYSTNATTTTSSTSSRISFAEE
jgi:hypothetical protein